jgi:hypothetical protein
MIKRRIFFFQEKRGANSTFLLSGETRKHPLVARSRWRRGGSVIEALGDLGWKERTVSIRINGIGTPYMYRDVVDVTNDDAIASLAEVRARSFST